MTARRLLKRRFLHPGRFNVSIRRMDISGKHNIGFMLNVGLRHKIGFMCKIGCKHNIAIKYTCGFHV